MTRPRWLADDAVCQIMPATKTAPAAAIGNACSFANPALPRNRPPRRQAQIRPSLAEAGEIVR
jgi:hypothetical protein